jgi:hypothetical protein
MKTQLWTSLVAVAALVVLARPGPAVPAAAAPDSAPPATEAHSFDGTFAGVARGADGSQAPLTLSMAQQGPAVDGTVTIGDGVYVKTPYCGGATIPAGTVSSSGQVDPQNPNRVTATAAFDVYGFPITIAAQGDLSDDGQSLAVRTKVDAPAFCGPIPVLEGTLQRTA